MDSSEVRRKDVPLYSMYLSPGPAYKLKSTLGSKDHCLSRKQLPSFSIGSRPKEQSEEKPGPNYSYDPKQTSHGRIHIPSVYISGRPKDKVLLTANLTPGPADYDLLRIKEGILSNENRPAQISIGQRSKFIEKSDAPPPNSYNLNKGLGSRTQTAPYAPAWSLRGRTEFGSSHYAGLKEATPGPANYAIVDSSVYKTAQPGFTIQGRTSLKNYLSIKDNPGPNAYDVQTKLKSNKKGFSMGIKHSHFVMPFINRLDV